MQAFPGPGERLRRLAELRGTALPGGGPDPGLLRRVAPALGLHTSDLFVIVDEPVPDDLTPLDTTGGAALLAWPMTYLPGAVPRLREFVASLPQLPRPPGPRPPVPSFQHYPDGPGGLLLRLLHNRNLTWTGAAKYLLGLGRGDALSASTIGMIGHGRKALTPELLTRIAALLDIPARDLSALTGVDVAVLDRPVHPDAAGAAALLWEARRLTGAQLSRVHDRAHVLRHECADEIDPLLRCSCPGPRDP
ncbi:XRE family transcriptional regulator [Actinoplanes sp. URMC 104]|uniref:XRE family transcriptional regulator n=1 Tax=Actinoplanes sp. URMC 104 TaxID=3423409 RepID=UPI003F195B8D